MVTRVDIHNPESWKNPPPCEPVGVADLVLLMLDFKPNTVRSWRERGILPPPRWERAGGPLWDWRLDILPWCLATRRSSRKAIAEEMARTGPPQPIVSPLPKAKPE